MERLGGVVGPTLTLTGETVNVPSPGICAWGGMASFDTREAAESFAKGLGTLAE